MKEKIKKVLNAFGYEVPETTTLLELVEMIQIHKKIVDAMEAEGVFIPGKRKTFDI